MNSIWLSIAAATLVSIPTAAISQCGGDTCSVGGAGTGGEKSGGKAQGFHVEFVSTVRIPGATIVNVGNLDSGHFTVTDSSGSSLGTASGTLRENPAPTARGRGTGLFGDWAGQCDAETAEEDPSAC